MGKSTVSVRKLQQNLKRVMARVERGEVVEVTRRVGRWHASGPYGQEDHIQPGLTLMHERGLCSGIGSLHRAALRPSSRIAASGEDLRRFVAAAHVVDCTTFVSADNRQLAVAKSSGLTAVDIKRRIRRQKS